MTPSARLFNKTCSIIHNTPSKSSVTGEVNYSQTAVTGVACKVDVKIAEQGDNPFRAGEEIYNFYFVNGQDVRSSDTIGSVTGYANYTFAVVSDPIDDVGRSAYTRVRARHVQGHTPA